MNEPATIVDGNTLTLVRDLPGPIERVWAYLTDPKSLAKWFSDGVVADFVGGEVYFEMGATGRVTVFEPPHVLEYTWNELDHSRGPITDSVVRWELSETRTGVRLTLTHSRLSEIEVVFHSAGWHAFLDRLSACVDGRAPEPIGELYARFKAEYGIREPHESYAAEYATVIDAAPSAVFAALTEPDKIAAFWGEAGVYQTTSWQHDFRVGGSYRHTTLHVDGTSQNQQQFARFGEYRAIDAPRALEYTSKYENDMPIAEVTTIRFDLEPANDGKTHLRVSQSGFESADMRDMHRAAWVQVFGWLNNYV